MLQARPFDKPFDRSMKHRIRQSLLASGLSAVLALTGCAVQSPALHEEPMGKKIVYELSPDHAKRLVHTVMSSHFAGRDIEPLPAPSIGFSTYTRVLIDTWSTNVSIIPVAATTDSRTFDAVRIETAGGGSSAVSGQLQYNSFRKRLSAELDNTGSMRVVDRYSIR